MVDEHPIVSVLRKHINVKVTVTDPFEIEKGMLRRFAIATGDTDPIYHDEDYARSSTYGEIISPPTFPFEWNHHAHGVACPRAGIATIARSALAGPCAPIAAEPTQQLNRFAGIATYAWHQSAAVCSLTARDAPRIHARRLTCAVLYAT